MYLKRFDTNPLITPATGEEIGININGPTLMRVPDFVEHPLGKYYLYFAHHLGQNIRMAYSDYPDRDFKLYPGGVLSLEQIHAENPCFCETRPGFPAHIASPEIYINEEKKTITLFFHSFYAPDADTKPRQLSGVAVSGDGLHFHLVHKEAIDRFYMRVFPWGGRFYSVTKNDNTDGQLAVSETVDGVYRPVGNFIENIRHTCVHLDGDMVYLFYTLVFEEVESIYCCRFLMEPGDRWDPKVIKSIKIAEPSTDWEGLCYPAKPSRFGSENHVRQLRDPFLYEENGVFYFYYSYAGEDGIAGGILDMDAVKRDLQ